MFSTTLNCCISLQLTEFLPIERFCFEEISNGKNSAALCAVHLLQRRKLGLKFAIGIGLGSGLELGLGLGLALTIIT